jgi:hypothetical protein
MQQGHCFRYGARRYSGRVSSQQAASGQQCARWKDCGDRSDPARRKVYLQSDVTNHPDLFARNPGWHAFFEQEPKQAGTARRAVYDMVVAESCWFRAFTIHSRGRSRREGRQRISGHHGAMEPELFVLNSAPSASDGIDWNSTPGSAVADAPSPDAQVRGH